MTHQGRVRSAQFSPDGTRVVIASDEGTRAAVGVRRPQATGRQRDGSCFRELSPMARGWLQARVLGAIEPLDDPVGQLNDLRKKTDKEPLGEPTAESFIRWFLSDPWTRTVSPLSSLTVPDYIQQQIAAGRRDEVALEFPGHPLLRPAPAP